MHHRNSCVHFQGGGPKLLQAVQRTFYRFAFTTSLLVAMYAALDIATPAGAQSDAVISANNEGVRALGASNFQLAIEKFKLALSLDSSYDRARSNLAIAYNNYGLSMQKNPKEAIKMFHKALMLNPANVTSRGNLEAIIRMLGRNPQYFNARVELGDAAKREGDLEGAIVEYCAALDIAYFVDVERKLNAISGIDELYRYEQAEFRRKYHAANAEFERFKAVFFAEENKLKKSSSGSTGRAKSMKNKSLTHAPQKKSKVNVENKQKQSPHAQPPKPIRL